MPYVFKSKEHAAALATVSSASSCPTVWKRAAALIVLGFGESGMRNLSNNSKEVTSPPI